MLTTKNYGLAVGKVREGKFNIVQRRESSRGKGCSVNAFNNVQNTWGVIQGKVCSHHIAKAQGILGQYS